MEVLSIIVCYIFSSKRPLFWNISLCTEIILIKPRYISFFLPNTKAKALLNFLFTSFITPINGIRYFYFIFFGNTLIHPQWSGKSSLYLFYMVFNILFFLCLISCALNMCLLLYEKWLKCMENVSSFYLHNILLSRNVVRKL